MTDIKVILVLASEMLELAQNEFSNHGCNDLEDKIVKLIPESMLEEMRQWNSKGKDPWPWNAESVGDSGLMHFLSYKLKDISTQFDRDVKINDILS